MFSEGIEYDVTDFMNNASAMTILNTTRDTISAATRANVAFYTVDPRGLTNYAEEGMAISPPTDADPGLNLGMSGIYNEGRMAQDSLRTLAEGTGGFAALNSNDFSTAFERIVDENSSYYVIGYYPTNDKRDGSFRRIDAEGVAARRDREVAPRLRGAPGQGAGAEGLPREDRDARPNWRVALNSPIQVGGCRLSVFAAPFRGEAPKATVALVTQIMPVTAHGRKPRTASSSTNSTCRSLPSIRRARCAAARATRPISRCARRPTSACSSTASASSRGSTCRPGRYQLRVALQDAGGEGRQRPLRPDRAGLLRRSPFR